MKKIKLFLFLALSAFLISCTLVTSTYEKPEIELVRLQSLERKGSEQIIAVRFNIVNPTKKELYISKFSYSLSLENIEEITGVVYGLSPIPSKGKTQVEFKLAVNIFSAFRILESAIKNKNGIIKYNLVTKVSSVWWKLPATSVKSGKINLADKYKF